jgi:replicative DNA helicase
MDAAAHGGTVLSAIVGGRGSMKALDIASTRLTMEHFEDPRQGKLFALLVRYALANHGIMTRAALEDVLRNSKAGSRLEMAEYYSALAKSIPARHEFLHAVEMLRVLHAERATFSVLTTGAEIIRSQEGVRIDDRTVLCGHEDARSFVLEALARIERDLNLAESPEGDAHDGADSILEAYARAKDLQMRGEAPGILFGIGALDRFIEGGLGNGEMAVLRAGTTIGKSRFCVQWAWHASVVQHKNVVYFTTETLKHQIDTNLVARHSRLPQFGLEQGLNARKIRAGRLSREEEAALDAVVKDFKLGDYGRLRTVQMPEHCTVAGMSARFAAIEKAFGPEFVVADYLQLFEPERRGRESKEYENQSGILKSAGRWCQSARNGAGVPFVTPWQVNRRGRENLRANGGYTLEDSSGTQEASNTPDLVLDLMDKEKDTSLGRRVPLELVAAKVRDGARGHAVPLEVDYATCYFAERGVLVEPDLGEELAASA